MLGKVLAQQTFFPRILPISTSFNPFEVWIRAFAHYGALLLGSAYECFLVHFWCPVNFIEVKQLVFHSNLEKQENSHLKNVITLFFKKNKI